MNKKVIILLTLVLLLASVANAQLKRTMGTADVGTVVGADGAAVSIADYLTEPAVGVVIFKDGTNSLVATSGLADVAVATASGGEALTYDATGAIVVATGDSVTYQPIIGYAVDASTILIKFENQSSERTDYTMTDFLGVTASNVQTVDAALDAIDAYLSDITATYRNTVTVAGAAVGSGTAVALVADIDAAIPGTIAEGDDLYLQFTGDFTDDASNNGAVVTVYWGNTGGGVVPTGNSSEINLMNYEFYQRQTVSIQGQVTVGATVGTYTVLADGDTNYDGARFVQGTLTVEKF